MTLTNTFACLSAHIVTLIRIAIIVGIGLPALWWLSRSVRKNLIPLLKLHVVMLITKAIRYVGLSVIIIMVLRQFGFDLSALLGAVGILGVALAFASQTSISNIISAAFLIIEDSFEVGDVITVSNITGTIESMDLFSMKLRTSEDNLVRIPNEWLLKNPVINTTYFRRRHFID